jgi:hypothetical protein
MKKLYLLILIVAFGFNSCSYISNKPVSDKLSTKELSRAMKNDTLFADFYENIRNEVDDMSDIKKATYNDVTYRRLFKYIKFLQDTTYWNPLSEKWEKEWESEFGIYIQKADSVLNYWKRYLEDNSLDKYVKIELARIDKEYYDYIGEIKEVNLGFRLSPLQGTIEQIRFSYGYRAKINGDSKYYERHNCISTSPFSSPTVRYWEVVYSDKDNFAGENVETFLRDYNLYLEITNIRKDGVNISIDDFSVPKEVSECLENEKDYPLLFELSKDELIKELISNDYLGKSTYLNKKADEIYEKKDKLCFDLLREL